MIDVKEVFDHVLQGKLAPKMANLDINNKFIDWIQLFLTWRSVELVIYGFANSWQIVEIGISQGLPISPILFFIYVNNVFSAVEIKLPNITCILFVDDLAFVIANYFIKKSRKNAWKGRKNYITIKFQTFSTIYKMPIIPKLIGK